MKYFKYTVMWYDDYQDAERTDNGVVCAESFQSAMQHIVDEYGENYVESASLEDIAIEGYCISTDDIKDMFKGELNESI